MWVGSRVCVIRNIGYSDVHRRSGRDKVFGRGLKQAAENELPSKEELPSVTRAQTWSEPFISVNYQQDYQSKLGYSLH